MDRVTLALHGEERRRVRVDLVCVERDELVHAKADLRQQRDEGEALRATDRVAVTRDDLEQAPDLAGRHDAGIVCWLALELELTELQLDAVAGDVRREAPQRGAVEVSRSGRTPRP